MDIEQATERCNQLIKAEHANWIGISNQIAIGTVLSELERLKEYENLEWQEFNELAVKDKIIEEMAKYIASLDTDEDICKNIQCTDGVNKLHKNCSECIKQYFTKKVEQN